MATNIIETWLFDDSFRCDTRSRRRLSARSSLNPSEDGFGVSDSCNNTDIIRIRADTFSTPKSSTHVFRSSSVVPDGVESEELETKIRSTSLFGGSWTIRIDRALEIPFPYSGSCSWTWLNQADFILKMAGEDADGSGGTLALSVRQSCTTIVRSTKGCVNEPRGSVLIYSLWREMFVKDMVMKVVKIRFSPSLGLRHE